jgi:hypothetical protein
MTLRVVCARGCTALGALVAAAVVLPSCIPSTPTGGPLTQTAAFGEVGLSPGQFSYPRCIDGDESTLWVIDKQARVQRLDPVTGDCLAIWQMPDWSNGKPTGVTVWEGTGGGGPLVFVADTHYHRIMIYAVDEGEAGEPGSGRLLCQFGTYGKGGGEFIYPTDVAIVPTPDGEGIARLYVSEYGENDRISVFDASGTLTKYSLLTWERGTAAPFTFAFSFGSFGSGASGEAIEFNRPQSIAVDEQRHELIVADACNHRLGRFTLDGALIAWISAPQLVGPEPGHFTYPYGLELLGDGTALVAEFGNNRVQHVDIATGGSLGVYGRLGRGEGEVATPWGVTTIGKTAYVLDSGNNRVLGFSRPRARPVTHATQHGGTGGPG